MKRFYEKGLLDVYWIDSYCFGSYAECVRYKKEKQGVAHPDNMLPDGSIDASLPA
jgi:hypothetical protein